MFWEKQVPEDWVVALTTTEFLVYPGLRLDLHEKQDRFPLPSIMHIPNLAMIRGRCEQRFYTISWSLNHPKSWVKGDIAV